MNHINVNIRLTISMLILHIIYQVLSTDLEHYLRYEAQKFTWEKVYNYLLD